MEDAVVLAKMKRKRMLQKQIAPFLYLAPALILIIMFVYYPFFKTIITSFFLTNATGRATEFIGTENYQNVLSDRLFIGSIRNTLIYTFIQVPITIFVSFMMAIAANKKRRVSRIYEILFSFSMAVSMSVAALVFKLLMNPQIGLLNYVTGLHSQWFNSPDSALLSIIILGIWLQLGVDFLFLLSAVRAVPSDLIEAGTIDGCSMPMMIRKIYVPMVSPTLFYLMCTNLAASMMMSGPVIVLTKGGPNNSTSTIIYYMYKKAFEIYNYGASYAAAIIGFVFAFVLILISFKFEKKGVHYN